MKLKREIFKRPTRMTHTFGDQMDRDPFFGGEESFKVSIPKGISRMGGEDHGTKELNVQKYGQRQFAEPRSPICKPGGGYASINGPKPDYADMFAQPIPQSDKKRRSK